MKILIPVINFGKSGGDRVLSKIADELISFGHTVDFMSSDASADPYFPTRASIKWISNKGEISETHIKGVTLIDSFFSIQQKLTKALKRISKDSYDVILASHSLTTLPIKKAGLIHKTFYYVQNYDPDSHNTAGGFKNKILAYLSEKSYKMNLFTIVNAKIYLNYKKIKARGVLYPGIDFLLFYPKEEKIIQIEKKSNTNKIIIGTIGRAARFKGTRYIVEAFKIIKANYPSAELHIAFGNPVDFKNQEGIYCFNPDGDKNLGDFYRSLHYYICAVYTQFGAFHYPIAEAMSCGIPVITTSYYPANDSNAWMIKPQNSMDIVNQFELAINNPTLKEKKVRQALCDVKQFDWKKVGEKLNNFLNEFLDLKK
jgi:glycosyltransferase involved in cell wall biosynthesis